MNTAVKTDNISKTYPGVLANSNVSITINASSIHAVVGENGAGKSTPVSYTHLRAHET